MFSRYLIVLLMLLVGVSGVAWLADNQAGSLGEEFRQIVAECRDLGGPERDGDRGETWARQCAVDDPESRFSVLAREWQSVVDRRSSTLFTAAGLGFLLLISLVARVLFVWLGRRSGR